MKNHPEPFARFLENREAGVFYEDSAPEKRRSQCILVMPKCILVAILLLFFQIAVSFVL